MSSTTNFREAVIAVTLNCNSRCLTCDIWKNKYENEADPEIYKKLPPTLREINITGGEPFLRNDLPEIIKNIKTACPKARILISTNGYLYRQIEKITPQILKVAPNIAIRVSLDGNSKAHNAIRRLPQYFNYSLKSLYFFKKLKIKDLGISFTLIEKNKQDLLSILNFCNKNHFEFSLTTASDSNIYFGKNKILLRPAYNKDLEKIFKHLIEIQLSSNHPKSWMRAWFNDKLRDYLKTNKRYYQCNAGSYFFYLDSFGIVYSCHLKPWIMGDLKKQTFSQISSNKLEKIKKCNDCWMICTARTSIKTNSISILKEVFVRKIELIQNQLLNK